MSAPGLSGAAPSRFGMAVAVDLMQQQVRRLCALQEEVMLHVFSTVASLLAAGAVAGQRPVVFHPNEQTRHPSVVVDQDGVVHLAYLAQEKGKQVQRSEERRVGKECRS